VEKNLNSPGVIAFGLLINLRLPILPINIRSFIEQCLHAHPVSYPISQRYLERTGVDRDPLLAMFSAPNRSSIYRDSSSSTGSGRANPTAGSASFFEGNEHLRAFRASQTQRAYLHCRLFPAQTNTDAFMAVHQEAVISAAVHNKMPRYWA
jgi:hypothetical protein